MSFNSIEDLYNAYTWKSPSKFIPLAVKYGFTAAEAKTFLKNNVDHDVIPKKAQFMHIYSKSGDEYQMDTFINDKAKDGVNYLIFININTRKAYAYEMKGKGSTEVLKALNEFVNDVEVVRSITSDQDAAYMNSNVLSFMKEHNIYYKTTEDNNHNILGIINRFMRTIRDYFGENRKITSTQMSKFITTYNNTPHKGINYKAPNDMNSDDEHDYITTMSKYNPYKFNAGDHVKVINVKSPFTKRRSNVSKQAYIVDSKAGNQFVIRAKDYAVDKYPGYMLVKTISNDIAETLKQGKRGIIDKILDYDEHKDKYHVVYEGGVKDFVKAKNLREGAPTLLSSAERAFWSTQKYIPNAVKKWI